jgi:hypothetical protein
MRRVIGGAALVVAALMGVASPAAAATITVDTTVTAPLIDGKCGIFEAVVAADFNSPDDACAAGTAGSDTIQFSLPTPATLNIAAAGLGALVVGPAGEPLIVKGPTTNPSDLTLDGGGSTRIFYTSANLTIRRMTLTGGKVTDADGAAVQALPDATVTLASTRFASNSIAASSDSGPGGHGACVSAPDISATNSTFSNNSADGDGGCLFATGSLSVTGSTFNANASELDGGGYTSGGALASGDNASQVTVDRSVFAGNTALNFGGAIWIGGSTVLDVSRTTFYGNGAFRGGAIYSHSFAGTVTSTGGSIAQSTFSGNGLHPPASEGGALDFDSGTLAVSGSTFSGNDGGADGGAVNVGDGARLFADDSTFDGNAAFERGSAIAKTGIMSGLSLTDSTVSAGLGPSSLWWSGAPPANLRRTIVASPAGLACDGSSPASEYNDIYAPGQEGTCPSGGTNLGADPKLSALGNFGGPTQTELPGHGSPAVDAIPPDQCPSGPPPPLDQRGVARPVGAGCDIGAVEVDTRPDGQIAQGGGTFVGDDVYNSSGAGQTEAATLAPGNSITFPLRAQSDAQFLRERLRVRGPGGDQYFRVKYTDHTGNDITSAITGSGFQTASLTPGTVEPLRVRVTVLAGTPTGATIKLRVNIASTRVPSRVDRVVAVVNAG